MIKYVFSNIFIDTYIVTHSMLILWTTLVIASFSLKKLRLRHWPHNLPVYDNLVKFKELFSQTSIAFITVEFLVGSSPHRNLSYN